jgi:hypothetical protein
MPLPTTSSSSSSTRQRTTSRPARADDGSEDADEETGPESYINVADEYATFLDRINKDVLDELKFNERNQVTQDLIKKVLKVMHTHTRGAISTVSELFVDQYMLSDFRDDSEVKINALQMEVDRLKKTSPSRKRNRDKDESDDGTESDVQPDSTPLTAAELTRLEITPHSWCRIKWWARASPLTTSIVKTIIDGIQHDVIDKTRAAQQFDLRASLDTLRESLTASVTAGTRADFNIIKPIVQRFDLIYSAASLPSRSRQARAAALSAGEAAISNTGGGMTKTQRKMRRDMTAGTTQAPSLLPDYTRYRTDSVLACVATCSGL